MVNKLVLMGFAVAAVGLVALPQTLALFAGQHNFYDTMTTNFYNFGNGSNIPCGKCHADVYAELKQAGAVNSVHLQQGCGGCHMLALQKEGFYNGPTGQFHAAAAPACLDCHDGNSTGINDARNIFGIVTNTTGDITNVEVHASFANQSNNISLLKGANEACVACHTHVAVNISWSKAYMMNFTSVAQMATDGSGTHSWNISSFGIQGSANITTYGNMSGENNASTAPVVTVSPTPPGWDPSTP